MYFAPSFTPVELLVRYVAFVPMRTEFGRISAVEFAVTLNAPMSICFLANRPRGEL